VKLDLLTNLSTELKATILSIGLLLLVALLWRWQAKRMFRTEFELALQIIARFVFLIGLPILVIIVAPMVHIFQNLGLQAGAWQAVIAGLVFLTGWLNTSITTEISRLRDHDERMNDVQKALYAEIRACLQGQLKHDDLDGMSQVIIARMRKERDDYVPLIPTEKNDTIFKAIVSDIHVLPRQSIDPVVIYYSQLAAIDEMIGDLRSPEYRTMDVDRRIQMYSDYIALKKQAVLMGEDALNAMDAVSRDKHA